MGYDIFSSLGGQSANFTAQELLYQTGGTAMPRLKPLLCIDKWLFNTQTLWATGSKEVSCLQEGVDGNIYVQLGQMPVGGITTVWISPILKSQFYSIPRLVWNLTTLGTYTITFAVQSSLTSTMSGAWRIVPGNGDFPNDPYQPIYQQGYYHQVAIMVHRNVGTEVSFNITSLRIESWWNIDRDPMQFTHWKSVGNNQREIENTLNVIRTQGMTVTCSNELGFWNPKGSVTNNIGSDITKMYRQAADSPATAGQYTITFGVPA